jgi:hypothetical protein
MVYKDSKVGIKLACPDGGSTERFLYYYQNKRMGRINVLCRRNVSTGIDQIIVRFYSRREQQDHESCMLCG